LDMRIAVGQISSESNHFVALPCELEFFRQTGFLFEDHDLFELRGTGGEVAGILSVLDAEPGVEIVPLLAARANSAGPLSAACWEYLQDYLLQALQRSAPVDGIILSHHGSMAAVTEDDPEGYIASKVRQMAGPDVPFAMTLDLHANVTRRMVEATSMILGYEQYPHRDVFETGARAARLLLRSVRREVRPSMTYAKLPMLLTAFHGSTEGDAPFARLMRRAKTLEADPRILSTSMFFVGSYIDVPEMGSGALVISDSDPERSTKECNRLISEFWRIRHEFDVNTCGVAEAVALGRTIGGGPILLLDTADTTGGGAAGDGAGLIKGLIDAGENEPALAMVVDPEAAAICAEAGVGREVTLRLGHKLDPRWGTPVSVRGKVRRVFEGRFRYTGGILGGSSATMGSSAVFDAGNVAILIASYATYDWADEQYQCAGLDSRHAKFVGIKNMMNFRYGYGDSMKGCFVLDLPGPTPPDMRMLPFRRLTRPVYPLDDLPAQPAVQMTASRAQEPHVRNRGVR
jgi:microcystin degradation protein MlrC